MITCSKNHPPFPKQERTIRKIYKNLTKIMESVNNTGKNAVVTHELSIAFSINFVALSYFTKNKPFDILALDNSFKT
jgi:hypothetical protein